MTKSEFLKLMRFPAEWDTLGIYPEELFEHQVALYRPGDEHGSEHDRNGAFHWWLRKGPSRREVHALRRLATADPDRALGEDMLRYLDDPTLPPGWVGRD
jgi:hypothetical protein